MFFSDGGVDGRRGAERRAEPQGGVDGGAGSDDAGGGADRRGDVGPRRGRRTGVDPALVALLERRLESPEPAEGAPRKLATKKTISKIN